MGFQDSPSETKPTGAPAPSKWHSICTPHAQPPALCAIAKRLAIPNTMYQGIIKVCTCLIQTQSFFCIIFELWFIEFRGRTHQCPGLTVVYSRFKAVLPSVPVYPTVLWDGSSGLPCMLLGAACPVGQPRPCFASDGFHSSLVSVSGCYADGHNGL